MSPNDDSRDFARPNGIFNESNTNLIVNYLPPTLSTDELRMLFESYGELETCKLCYHKITGQNLCYGFVKYSDKHNAQKAVKCLNGLRIQNKIIKVSYARPSSESIKGANLYVCGIPKHWTNSELNEYFSKCGAIITSRILYSRKSGQSKCIAFIRYNQRCEAEVAVKELSNTVPPDGQEPIMVKLTSCLNLQQKPISFASSISSAIDYFGTQHATSYFLNLNPNPCLNTITQMAPFYTTQAATYNSSTTETNGWSIFVYNLPHEMTDENILWEMFCPFGAVQSTKLIKDQTHKFRGYGFVTMTSYTEALAAIGKLNGSVFKDHVLQVSFKTE